MATADFPMATCVAMARERTRSQQLASSPPLGRGFRRTMSRLEGRSTVDQRIIDAVIGLVGEGGYRALSHQAIRARAEITNGVLYDRFGTPDAAFRAAYASVSDDLLDELDDCGRATENAAMRARAAIAALVDFSALGGGRADVWLLAVLDASRAAQEWRTAVLRDMAQRILHEPDAPAVEIERWAERDLFALGGVLSVLSQMRRERDYVAMRRAEPELVAHVASVCSD
jgi:AcrR family transcriptional regulator